jgi:hypothetical protein
MPKHKRHGPPRGSAKRVALPRFQREHWPRWLETADDREAWEATFEVWQQAVDARADRLRRAGLEITWIDLEPESFGAWCQSRAYPNNAESRNRFAAEQVGNIPPPPQPNHPQEPATEARNGP